MFAIRIIVFLRTPPPDEFNAILGLCRVTSSTGLISFPQFTNDRLSRNDPSYNVCSRARVNLSLMHVTVHALSFITIPTYRMLLSCSEIVTNKRESWAVTRESIWLACNTLFEKKRKEKKRWKKKIIRQQN